MKDAYSSPSHGPKDSKGTGRRPDVGPYAHDTSEEGSCCCQRPGTALLISDAFFSILPGFLRNLQRDRNGPVWHQRSLPASLTPFFTTSVLPRHLDTLACFQDLPFKKNKSQSSSEIEPKFTRDLFNKSVTLYGSPSPTSCYGLWIRLHSKYYVKYFPSRHTLCFCLRTWYAIRQHSLLQG